MKQLVFGIAFGFLFSCSGPEQPVTPTNEEDCGDGVDEDLDGDADCADTDCVGTPDCFVPTQEICNDSVDNDVDGATDCDDTDCNFAQNCQPPVPEVCTPGSGDEDSDGLSDCQDPDCTAQPICGPEDCDNGVDDNQNGAADCQDYGCTQDPFCVANPAEICTDGVDNDGDGALDCADSECTTDPNCVALQCNPANDQCGGNDICIVNTCQNAFGRQYRISGLEVALTGEDANGDSWDTFGGDPDPKIEIFFNGNQILETSEKSNTNNATYSETVNLTINSGNTLDLRILDVDVDADDFILTCDFPVSADLLRFRDLECSIPAIGTLFFSINPL